jgi:hypothetical protein
VWLVLCDREIEKKILTEREKALRVRE